jgi:hypothetical protein
MFARSRNEQQMWKRRKKVYIRGQQKTTTKNWQALTHFKNSPYVFEPVLRYNVYAKRQTNAILTTGGTETRSNQILYGYESPIF